VKHRHTADRVVIDVAGDLAQPPWCSAFAMLTVLCTI
jgi:hypothetical protein